MIDEQELLEKAIALATEKHAWQKDKGGKPYILHPLRVMVKAQREMSKLNKDLVLATGIVAVLHDVVKDTDITFDDLREAGFSSMVVETLQLLTRNQTEDYSIYIGKIASSDNPVAITVKLFDLQDNMDVSKLNSPLTQKDQECLLKYKDAIHKLLCECYGASGFFCPHPLTKIAQLWEDHYKKQQSCSE